MSLLILFTLSVLTILPVFSFYRYVSRLRWEENERRSMERAELNLAHLLTILDQSDTRILEERSLEGRRFLFLEYSRGIKDDILNVLRARPASLEFWCLALLFFCSYYLLRFKARLSCARSDLRYLCGLGLMVFRRADSSRS